MNLIRFFTALICFGLVIMGCSEKSTPKSAVSNSENANTVSPSLFNLSHEYFAAMQQTESKPLQFFYRKKLIKTLNQYTDENSSDYQRFLFKGRLLAQIPEEEEHARQAFRKAIVLAPGMYAKYRSVLELYQKFPAVYETEKIKKDTHLWLDRLIMIADQSQLSKQGFLEVIDLFRITRQTLEQRSQSMDTALELKMKLLLSREPYQAYYRQYSSEQKNQRFQQVNAPVVLK